MHGYTVKCNISADLAQKRKKHVHKVNHSVQVDHLVKIFSAQKVFSPVLFFLFLLVLFFFNCEGREARLRKYIKELQVSASFHSSFPSS